MASAYDGSVRPTLRTVAAMCSEEVRKRLPPTAAILLAVALVVSLAAALLSGGGPAVAPQSVGAIQLEPEEQELLGLINDYRVENGLQPLNVSPTLTAAAEWMAWDMAENGYNAHTDSLGRQPSERVVDFGYDYATWTGENVAAGQPTAQIVFDVWRNSPGHNTVMLLPEFRVIGLGHAYNGHSYYGHYWTIDLGGYDDSGSPPPTSTPSPTPSPTPTPTPSPTPTPTPSPTPTPAPPGRLLSCPLPGKWSSAVYSGPDAPIADALATCEGVDVTALYWLHPQTQGWLRYFPGQPEVSNLTTLHDLQGVMVLGSAGTSSPGMMGAASVGAQGQGQLENCPPPGKWAISVWNGGSGVSTEQALATCEGVGVAAVYWLDPQTQAWLRFFPGPPGVSHLSTPASMQGVLALGVVAGGDGPP